MLALIFLAATAAAVPNFDIDKMCKGASVVQGSQDAVAGCVKDESAAKERLIKAWPTYSAGAREECASDLQHEYGVSYIEIETCFQMHDWKAHPADVGGTRVPGAHGPQLR
jgi:hypothetical protein